MHSENKSVYQDWLFERGIMESPVADAAGVFLHDVSSNHSTLIVAEISDENVESDKTLLVRLSAAVGDDVSTIGVKKNQPIPWYFLFDQHRVLKNLILLGDEVEQSLRNSNVFDQFKLVENMIIRGPSPNVLASDLSAKRILWQALQKLKETSLGH